MSSAPVIEIFKPGTWQPANGPALTFTATDLEASARAYDPQLHEAPIVIGHPKTDAPAYGWVKGLGWTGQVLAAQAGDLDSAFAELVRQRRFSKVSSSFYAPDAPNNPKPGVYYLRHVGFLGAAPPAVKGLRDATFDDGGEGIVEFSAEITRTHASLWRRLREFLIARFGAEAADQAVPTWNLEDLEREAARGETSLPAFTETPKGEEQMNEQELAAREKALQEATDALAKREAAVTAKEAAFAERDRTLREAEVKRRRTELVEFVDGLTKEGKVLPRDRGGLVEVLVSIDAAAPVEFTEGETKVAKKPSDWLRSFLGGLPQQVDFTERAPSSQGVPTDDPQAVAEAAQAYLAEKAKAGIQVRTSEAVRAVTKRS